MHRLGAARAQDIHRTNVVGPRIRQASAKRQSATRTRYTGCNGDLEAEAFQNHRMLVAISCGIRRQGSQGLRARATAADGCVETGLSTPCTTGGGRGRAVEANLLEKHSGSIGSIWSLPAVNRDRASREVDAGAHRAATR